MPVMKKSHIFALYASSLHSFSPINRYDRLVLSDQELAHRIKTVLRMNEGEKIILFNGLIVLEAHIVSLSKKAITLYIQEINTQKPYEVKITLLLPLLKKAMLEEAVYNATEMGVTAIQLVSTRTSRQEITTKEYERLYATMIAAAEQSKNYGLSIIRKAISYQDIFEHLRGEKSNQVNLVADPHGVSCIDFIKGRMQEKGKEITVLIGPEAGLTDEELVCAGQNGFVAVRLTSTVLRAVQAATLSVGIIRSL